MTALFVMATPASPQSHGTAVEPGVAHSLAVDRKSRISNLTYDLHFDLPAEVELPVEGTEAIAFDYVPERGHTLAIDFRAPASAVKSVVVNGTAEAVTIADEHILVPDSLLHRGKNTIDIGFTAGSRSLNRRPDYMYTLFVPDRARTVFPCFDQPDLKATFRLSLTMPQEWKAVSNSPTDGETPVSQGRKTLSFKPTEPLSTYLFAFAAGKFDYASHTSGRHTIGAYYRETDSAKIAQLPAVFNEVAAALDWQEEFTGVSYPFAKYDLVILPGFQFGGMEHTGATFYNDNSIFTSPDPTPDNLLRRVQLIAHETTHMWFGDYVTMRWFDDVWTKEVFANYFGAAITRARMPQLDHDLEWLRHYATASMSEDRGPGGTAIRQSLDNLSNAGLIYNNIIYNKAPVMLAKLVDLMGEDAFREGIRRYVAAFPYGNADWDELVDILQSCTDKDVRGFSQSWVYSPGMPNIHITANGAQIKAAQTDPRGNGALWPQRFGIGVITSDGSLKEVEVEMTGTDSVSTAALESPLEPGAVIVPNCNGKGYGLFTTDEANTDALMALVAGNSDALSKTARLATLMNLRENFLAGNISSDKWLDCCLGALEAETDPQTAATIVTYIADPLWDVAETTAAAAEMRLWQMAGNHAVKSVRKPLVSLIAHNARSTQAVDSVRALWQGGVSEAADERMLMSMAYELAIRKPVEADAILAAQRARLSNPDRISEFDFVSRAAVADTAALDSLFRSFLIPSNREIEPWTVSALALLNHPLRASRAVAYITPALEALPDIQRTNDIFFPGKWCASLLGSHRSASALSQVENFLKNNPLLNPLLRNKILNGAQNLMRVASKK